MSGALILSIEGKPWGLWRYTRLILKGRIGAWGGELSSCRKARFLGPNRMNLQAEIM